MRKGRKKGGPNEGYSAYWRSLLGISVAEELVQQAHREIATVVPLRRKKENYETRQTRTCSQAVPRCVV